MFGKHKKTALVIIAAIFLISAFYANAMMHRGDSMGMQGMFGSGSERAENSFEAQFYKKERLNFWDYILSLFGLISEPDEKEQSQIKEKLKKALYGAYPKEASPNGTLKEFNMTAAPSEVEIVPGYKTRVWAYNDQVPGPVFRIKLGDTFKLNFKNNLAQETTIHFHGVRVPNAMDGVPGVTQPPIKPGESFVYEFTPKDPGTYWFHPHVRSFEQVERGLYGILIVEDEVSEKYDRDELWVVDDWRLTQDAQVYPYFMIMPDLMHDGRWGNVITVNAKLKESLKTKPGERIHLRFVNSSNARIYRLDFGDLDAKAIAVDGMYVKENFDPNGFDLAPGNRLDVDIKVHPQDRGKTFVIKDIFEGQENVLGSIEVADEQGKELANFPYPHNDLVPDWRDAAKLPSDKLYVLDRKMLGMGKIVWTINGKAYPDHDPVKFKYDTFNKITFRNDSPNFHPMHLHGQFFKLISRDGKVIDEPFFRDTVLVYPRETVEIATVPYDRGRWMSHCHILEHADAGMMTIVEVE